jgi:DNA-binding NarL/FixJ family response regulator
MTWPSGYPAEAPVTVVLADRHPRFRGGLRALLSVVDDVTVAGEATSGPEAMCAVLRHRPDVLVFDPGQHAGIATIREIRAAAPGTAILILTALDDDASVRAAIRAGARGYLVKGAVHTGIVHAIRSLAAGEVIFGAGIAGRIATLLGTPVQLDELTAREQEILDLLAAGMSTAAIARRLRLAPKTVRNHLSSIFTKLRVTGRDEAIAHIGSARDGCA